ncbi:SDR family NAD(P)-dependent oxidoreductase [Noviherbaspirillum massiliense]|uniref:SDR family NAD(P)-dependent oxidoreductase n=1 Tax=Noviherbaspirillum massiliense TaxID=1465823 RepID=UPI0003095AD5|nr:SDR family NAD(P)-dependent oxidoreductase [Noviherbaspirillum massiliense]
MKFDLEGSVAVVTGAAQGIGAALALELAHRACDLALVDRDASLLVRSAQSARDLGVYVTQYQLDIADAAGVAALPDRIVADHGRVNILINNAGVAMMGNIEQLSLDDFEWLMNINFWGVVRTTKAFLPLLRREPQAHISNLSSVFGLIAPTGQGPYCASKFAVRGFSEVLRHELRDSNITVSTVHPGGIKTRIAHHSRRAAGFDEQQARELADKFFRLVRTSPQEAARCIVRGIERRSPRVLIGADARLLDWLSRYLPLAYWPLIRKLFEVPPSGSAQPDATLKQKVSP